MLKNAYSENLYSDPANGVWKGIGYVYKTNSPAAINRAHIEIYGEYIRVWPGMVTITKEGELVALRQEISIRNMNFRCQTNVTCTPA